MKKATKILVTVSVFSAAINMNGCGVYGPPPEGFDSVPPTATPVIENVRVIAEPPDWYFSAMGQYAVVRLLSVAEEESVPDGQSGNVVCGIEILSIYNPRLDLGLPSIIKIPGEDSASFAEGDVLFVELGPVKYDGEAYSTCSLRVGEKGAIFAPFTDNRLVLTPALSTSMFYSSLSVYNDQIQEYRLKSEKGEAYFMEFGTQLFEEGMTTEQVETFFQEFQKAKKDYEVVLKETNGTK